MGPPDLTDTDGDGFGDLVELPCRNGSHRTGSVRDKQGLPVPRDRTGLRAETMGVTQQFQTINKLGVRPPGPTWAPSFVSSNAWFYQLMSTREVDSKLFRVITNRD